MDFFLPAARVIGLLQQLALVSPLPPALACDNGREFTSQPFDQWAHQRGIGLDFIRPGKSVENAYVESFDGRLRDGFLNESRFASLTDSRRTVAARRIEYYAARAQTNLDEHTPQGLVEGLNVAQVQPKPNNRYEYLDPEKGSRHRTSGLCLCRMR